MGKDLDRRVAALRSRGATPTLAIVRVGDRASDLSYERAAANRADGLGISVVFFALGDGATTEELAAVIGQVNADARVHGCLLLRPLPSGVDEPLVCDLLAPEKDVDGISRTSLAHVFAGAEGGFAPATAEACLRTLDFYDIPVEGRHAVVIGRSLVIGRPVAMMLLERNATVTICHSRTADLATLTRAADVVVCATGRARAYGAAYFSAGQTVLDVGVNVDEDGKLCGDVDFAEVEPVVDAITPVPGGIGSVTTSVTMAHVVSAAEVAAGICA